MAAVNTLVLKNAAAANVNFVPFQVAPDSVTWVETAGSSMAANRKVVQTRKLPAGSNTKSPFRHNGKLVYPVLDSVTGAVRNQALGSVEFVIPQDMPTADKNEFKARFNAMMDLALWGEAIDTNTIPY